MNNPPESNADPHDGLGSAPDHPPMHDGNSGDPAQPAPSAGRGSAVEPSPDTDELASGVPYRALAMVLLALVVIAVGVGLVQLLGDDDNDDDTNAAANSTTATSGAPGAGTAGAAGAPGAPGAPGAAAPGVGAPGANPGDATAPSGTPTGAGDPNTANGTAVVTTDAEAPGAAPGGAAPDGTAPGGAAGTAAGAVNVTVYNNSLVTGLADQVAGQLRSSGTNVTEVGNFADANIPSSGVYFGTGPGEQAEAERIAAQLGIEARPREEQLAQAPGGVVVIVTQDLQR